MLKWKDTSHGSSVEDVRGWTIEITKSRVGKDKYTHEVFIYPSWLPEEENTADWHEENISDLDEAKKFAEKFVNSKRPPQPPKRASSLYRAVLKVAQQNPEFAKALKAELASKTAASEIDVQMLPHNILEIAKVFGKPYEAWEGIHGHIAHIKMTHEQLGRNKLKILLRPEVRWIEMDGKELTIGFTHG